MKVGMGFLNLSRKDFWALTLREYFAMHEAKFGLTEEPITRQDLKDMMARYPD